MTTLRAVLSKSSVGGAVAILFAVTALWAGMARRDQRRDVRRAARDALGVLVPEWGTDVSKVRLAGGLGLMLAGAITFTAGVICAVDVLSPGPADWIARSSQILGVAVYGVLTTWCAVIASGQNAA